MGRLRNLSASFKAAAFPTSSSGNTSPISASRPIDSGETKEVPVLAREASANSTNSIPNGNRPVRSSSRPSSVIYTPPTLIAGREEEIEELKPVFSYLSSHSNKLYQEGYFLKLDDLDTHGKPNHNRNWTECFAQLVGTVLSLWDAAALDAAGQDGEVAPSFINLADASIKMIETLPTRSQDVQPLQNVLSISTAGKNRYLLHFNSLHSLTQWTAGIRLAMFENASLHELYTGSLIAGKGRQLNNINQIMTKNRFRIEDWVRVRFGAGTPWRRCWCVVEPPDEKEWQKSNKKMGKRSAYDRPTYPKGDIKFYDTKKIKKAIPIATITDAYSAYAVYPQAKPLINESTLVKLEGKITIHSNPESKTEGFVFVMPELHPAVTGFEMLLRWLLPVYDTFSLYGRPTRLIPDTLDTRSLMFAMPRERRYGYLDIMDIAALIHTEGSEKWTEREWRKRMKDATAKRMTMQIQGKPQAERAGTNMGSRTGIHFSDGTSGRNTPSHKHNQSTDAVFEMPKKAPTAPAVLAHNYHARSVSETVGLSPSKHPKQKEHVPSRLSEDHAFERPDASPALAPQRRPLIPLVNEAEYVDSANSSDSENHPQVDPEDINRDMAVERPVQPVAAPPSFSHQHNDQPRNKPVDRPEMRREKSRMSNATLSQMVEANKQSGMSDAGAAAAAAWRQNGPEHRGVNETPLEDDEQHAKRPAVLTQYRSHSERSINRKPVPNTSSPLRTADAAVSDTGLNIPRTRGGERKIVGDANYETRKQSDILDINFGATERLSPSNSRPGSRADPRSAMDISRPGTGRLSPLGNITPVSAPAGLFPPFDFENGAPISPPHTPERLPRSPERTPERTPEHRPYAWQPGAVARGSPGGLTAEEFVAQRAALATRPQYSPQSHRAQSSGRVEQMKVEQQRPGSPRKLQKKSGLASPGYSPQLFSSGAWQSDQQQAEQQYPYTEYYAPQSGRAHGR